MVNVKNQIISQLNCLVSTKDKFSGSFHSLCLKRMKYDREPFRTSCVNLLTTDKTKDKTPESLTTFMLSLKRREEELEDVMTAVMHRKLKTSVVSLNTTHMNN